MREPILLSEDDYSEAYGVACDAVCRSLWPADYGIEPGDGLLHTSEGARRVTTAVFEAVGIWMVPDNYVPPPEDLPESLHRAWIQSTRIHEGDEGRFRDYLQRLRGYLDAGDDPGAG